MKQMENSFSTVFTEMGGASGLNQNPLNETRKEQIKEQTKAQELKLQTG